MSQAITCENCGTANKPEAKQCQNCGELLIWEGPVPESAGPPQPGWAFLQSRELPLQRMSPKKLRRLNQQDLDSLSTFLQVLGGLTFIFGLLLLAIESARLTTLGLAVGVLYVASLSFALYTQGSAMLMLRDLERAVQALAKMRAQPRESSEPL